MFYKRFFAAVLGLLLVTLIALPTTHGAETDTVFTFVWMTDTQHLSSGSPQIFQAMTKWIADNRDALNIRYVFHTGDIVSQGKNARQWQNAHNALSVLDGAVPYGVLAGNHDKAKTSGNFQQYFGQWRFEKNGVYGGGYKDNLGHYDIVNAGGKSFIMLYLSHGIDSKGIRWADAVLKRYPGHTAFLCFHSYLGLNAKRTGPGRVFFSALVEPNPNVKYVLSGHKHGFAVYRTELIDGDKTRNVFQMLANYQSKPQGGGGRMRVMTADVNKGTLSIRTFSPLMETDPQALLLPLY